MGTLDMSHNKMGIVCYDRAVANLHLASNVHGNFHCIDILQQVNPQLGFKKNLVNFTRPGHSYRIYLNQPVNNDR